MLKLRRGGVHLAVNVIPLDKLARFGAGRLQKRYQVLEAPGLSYQYLGFNMKDPLLGRKEVRQAIAMAIDVDVLITHRQRGHSTRATGSVSRLPGDRGAADAGRLGCVPMDIGDMPVMRAVRLGAQTTESEKARV